jgi:glyoxalase family protein
MSSDLLGIHHVTAIAGDPQANLDFYTKLLGMRMVKLTVNFDDPGSYHFYFGDRLGSPGTALTFFPHPGGLQGSPGAGQATTISFAIPEGTLEGWMDYLAQEAIHFEIPASRFGQKLIELRDPDGIRLELIEAPEANIEGWSESPVGPQMAIRGFHSVTVEATRMDANDRFYTETMRFKKEGEEDGRIRYRVGAGIGSIVDVVESDRRGRVAIGTVHHVAFRTPDDEGQSYWLETAQSFGLHSSPVMERDYFRSIYFREPNGVLFEIATDGPGFTIDESEETLGTALKLPARYEPFRSEIERRLPPIDLPVGVSR